MEVNNGSSTSAVASSTSQESRAIAEWSKLFPREMGEDYTSSATFIHQLITIAVNTITCLRNMMPEESYRTETFRGITLKILKTECQDKVSQTLGMAIANCYNVIKDKYLTQLELCVCDGNYGLDPIKEMYSFEISYLRDGGAASCDNRSAKVAFENIRRCTQELLEACIALMHTPLRIIMETDDIFTRIVYDKGTPLGYYTPGFNTQRRREFLEKSYTPEQVAVLGCVSTPYHKLVLRSYTPSQEPEVSDEDEDEDTEFEVSDEDEDEDTEFEVSDEDEDEDTEFEVLDEDEDAEFEERRMG